MTAQGILAPVRPCIKCGATERYKSGACKACEKARTDAWRVANPEKAKNHRAAWAAANPDKIKATQAAWYEANKDKHNASVSEWRAANSDHVAALGAAWRAANPDRKKATDAAWRVANQDKRKARNAAWNAANPGRNKASNAAWREANPDKAKSITAAWREANPEAKRIYDQNRRARKKASGGTLSKGLAAKLFKLQKGKCPCCKQPLGDDYHLDHIMPLHCGGSNTDDNMQLLRAVCNMQKHVKHPIDFMQSRGFLL